MSSAGANRFKTLAFAFMCERAYAEKARERIVDPDRVHSA
jgi:hypothetical protein